MYIIHFTPWARVTRFCNVVSETWFYLRNQFWTVCNIRSWVGILGFFFLFSSSRFLLQQRRSVSGRSFFRSLLLWCCCCWCWGNVGKRDGNSRRCSSTFRNFCGWGKLGIVLTFVGRAFFWGNWFRSISCLCGVSATSGFTVVFGFVISILQKNALGNYMEFQEFLLVVLEFNRINKSIIQESIATIETTRHTNG